MYMTDGQSVAKFTVGLYSTIISLKLIWYQVQGYAQTMCDLNTNRNALAVWDLALEIINSSETHQPIIWPEAESEMSIAPSHQCESMWEMIVWVLYTYRYYTRVALIQRCIFLGRVAL